MKYKYLSYIKDTSKRIRNTKRNLYTSFTEKGSPGFDKFLEILGERIRLKNWDKYRGGLDIKGIFSFSHVDTLHRNITLELLFSISIISKALI